MVVELVMGSVVLVVELFFSSRSKELLGWHLRYWYNPRVAIPARLSVPSMECCMQNNFVRHRKESFTRSTRMQNVGYTVIREVPIFLFTHVSRPIV